MAYEASSNERQKRYRNRSLFVEMGVLEQIYKPYIGLQLYYDDMIYHKYDAELKVDLIKELESMW